MTQKSGVMRSRLSRMGVVALISSLLPAYVVSPAQPAYAASSPFIDGAFENVWTRNDQPVAAKAVARSWTWGPAPLLSGYEAYAEAPDGSGQRLVQYFDKARMEINNPGLAPTDPWYVTNGLLTVELISGRLQVGDNTFQTGQPALINIASDPGDTNAPTYSSFGTVSNTSAGERRQSNKVGSFATEEIDRQGQVRDNPERQTDVGEIVYYEEATGHNVPQVFWNFLNSAGPVRSGVNNVERALLEPWVFAMGYPISDAYWATVMIEGRMQPVLIQAFERRVLTYAPELPPEWQVQMGNIGAHYMEWRYGAGGAGPEQAVKSAPGSPAYLSIPMLGVLAPVEHVGVDANNNMDIPKDPFNVAWYKYGPAPGMQGNSVMDGHLDWYGIDEAIFYYLDRLRPGDRVYVRDDVGVDRAFAVTESLVCAYNNCPLEDIFGATSATRLNLITCNGTFNRSQQNYDRRLVVFTEAMQ